LALSLVDLLNGIYTTEGSSLLDDNVLSGELASDLVGEFTVTITGTLAGS